MDALTRVDASSDSEASDLEGYLALTDSIVHLILHCSNEFDKEEDRRKLQKVNYGYQYIAECMLGIAIQWNLFIMDKLVQLGDLGFIHYSEVSFIGRFHWDLLLHNQ